MKAILLRTTQLTLVCAFMLLASADEPVLAHGDGRTLHCAHVAVGAYYLTIWTAPTILRTGEIHVEATLFDQNGRPAQSGLIHVTLTPLERQDPPLSALAQSVGGVRGGLHTAVFNIEQPGRYQVAVTVTDKQGSGGTVAFVMTIRQVPGFVRFMIYSQLFLALGAGVWLLQKGVMIWSGRTNGI